MTDQAGNAHALQPIDTLTAYARNSRRHSPGQIEQLARSIQQFGLVGAIVVRAGVIAKGHGTLAAVRSLRERGEAIYLAPGKAAGGVPLPDGLVPVLDVSGWTDDQFRAYVIADNRLSDLSDWDADMLELELEELTDSDFDFDHLAFDFSDILDAQREDEQELDANAARQPDTDPTAGNSAPDTGAPTAERKKPNVFPVMCSLNRAQYERLQHFKRKNNLTDTDVLMRGI